MDNQAILDVLSAGLELIGNTRAIVVGNINYEFIYATKMYYEMTSFSDVIIGKKLKDTNHPARQYAAKFKEITEKVINTGKTFSYLLIINSPHDKKKTCYLNKSSAVINPHTNKVAGIVMEVELFNSKFIANFVNIVHRLADIHNIDDKFIGVGYNLNTREEEVLFLLMIGRSYKEIANILNHIYSSEISPSAINSIIRKNLFRKFDSSSVRELIRKYSQSCVSNIPPNLLKFVDGVYEVTY